MSFGNATFGVFIVGQASRLPSNDLRSQARRPRYIQKLQKQATFGITLGFSIRGYLFPFAVQILAFINK
jgi:hypothetical protein